MKNMVRFICSVLAISFLMIVPVSCNKTQVSPTSEAVVQKELTQVELSVFGWAFSRVAEDETADIYKYFKDNYKVTFKPLTATWDNWQDKLNMYIASGDIPDIFTNYLFEKPETYEKWMREDVLLPIDEYSSKFPNIKKRLDDYSDLESMQGGKVYGIPIRSENRDVEYHNSHLTWIRKDWLENLKLNVPTTIDEFYNVAKAFTFNDPDKNGKNDTFGWCTGDDGVYWAYPIFNAFGASLDSWKKKGDTWIPEVVSTEMKSAVQFYKKLYDEKILDPEFFTTNYSSKIDKFITGKIGMMTLNAGTWYETYYTNFQKVYPDKKPEDIFTWLPVLKGPDGAQRIFAMENYFAFTSINADLSEDKQQRALMVLDFLLSPNGVELTRYGIEGKHFTKQGEVYTNLIPKDGTGYPVNIDTLDGTAFIKNLVNWDQDFFYDEKPLKDIMIKTLKENDKYTLPNPLSRVYIASTDFSMATRSKLNQFVLDEIVKLVYESKEYDTDWNNFVKAYDSLGGEELTKVMNQKAVEAGK